jgi:methyltransferase (TIGR00027 family)
MFKSLKRITYPVPDIDKAKEWYARVLGMQPVYDTPFATIFKLNDCSLSLAKSGNVPPENTGRIEVFWEVDDIDMAFQKLVQNGARIQSPVSPVMNIRMAKVIDPFGNMIGLTGPAAKKEEQTIENQPSETAMTTAYIRALSAKDDRQEIKGPDFLAEIFLPEEAKKGIIDAQARKWSIEKLVKSPLYGFLIARTAFFDSLFIDACREVFPQIVFLGAGYDTRSCRFIDRIKKTRIFELDISTTQHRKVGSLKREGVKIPESLSFVPINFKTEKLKDVLFNAGYDARKKTLFIWEGVTYYLSEEAVKGTLDFISKNSPSGSVISFDYMDEKTATVKESEPFLFWTARDSIAGLLSDYGIKIIDHLDSSVMEKKFLTLKDGTLAEKAFSKFCLVKAEISGK